MERDDEVVGEDIENGNIEESNIALCWIICKMKKNTTKNFPFQYIPNIKPERYMVVYIRKSVYGLVEITD